MGNTVINNQFNGTAAGIGCAQKTAAEIIGNHVTGNRAVNNNGGGIWVRTDIAGTIAPRGNVVEHNYATDAGGGIFFQGLNGSPGGDISENIVYDNEARGESNPFHGGGGIYLESTDVHVHHNTVVLNAGGGP